MLHGLAQVKNKLNPPRKEAAGEVPQAPAERAACIILDILEQRSGSRSGLISGP
jgi:hypothetical protein